MSTFFLLIFLILRDTSMRSKQVVIMATSSATPLPTVEPMMIFVVSRALLVMAGVLLVMAGAGGI